MNLYEVILRSPDGLRTYTVMLRANNIGDAMYLAEMQYGQGSVMNCRTISED